jgi:hypothetical protein
MAVPIGTNQSDHGEDKSGFDNPSFAILTA